MTIPKHYTVDEVAEITSAPRSTIFHWIYTGQLGSVKVGRRRLIREPDLKKFLQCSDEKLSTGRR